MQSLDTLVSQLSLEEKVALCSGEDFWHTKSIPHVNIPSLMMCDGPHGLRKQPGDAQFLEMNDSEEAICFPTAATTACSFDVQLLKRLGQALGEECQAEKVGLLLGPAINIKRSPLGGRNFEYFSEDPHLTGELATAYILGLQQKGVGACLKHFACNNQESYRMTASSEVDERTLHEIYFPGFEKAIKEAKPWSVMSSYNRLNGEYVGESYSLLTNLLRDKWGFDGFIVSDWGAVNDRVSALKAGMDLQMPGHHGMNDDVLLKAVKHNEIDEEVLDQSVKRLLKKVFKSYENNKQIVVSKDQHHQLAKEIAVESAVLLKNQGVLPLKESGNRLAFIGEFAKAPRYQGGGSSHIHPYQIDTALEAVKGITDVSFAQGFLLEDHPLNERLLHQAIELAKSCDVAVIFAGLPESFETEFYDRPHMKLPAVQNKLIQEVAKVQKNTVVVLHNGAPVEMPWVNEVNAILEMYLSGEAVGEATVDLLFGRANPSGKLAETFPLRLGDHPAYLSTKVVDHRVYYNERLFVGYRYYDARKMDVLFPFGHGCSYTTFQYDQLKLSRGQIAEDEPLVVQVNVTNTGNYFGKEVVQLYVENPTGDTIRPVKELRQFKKVALSPKQTQTVTFTLTKRDFSYYHPTLHDWYVETGEYGILLAKSSRDIVLRGTIKVKGKTKVPTGITTNTTFNELIKNPKLSQMITELIETMKEDYQLDIGMIQEMPIRALASFQVVDQEMVNRLVTILNILNK